MNENLLISKVEKNQYDDNFNPSQKEETDRFWVLHSADGKIVYGKEKLIYFHPKQFIPAPRWKINGKWHPIYYNPEIETQQRLLNLAKFGFIWKVIELPCVKLYEGCMNIPKNRKGLFWEPLKYLERNKL